MADIDFTSAQVALVDPTKAFVKSYKCAVAITKGQTVYILTNGTIGLADANASAPAPQFRGIALQTGAAGQTIDVCHEGELYGFSVSGLNVGALLYQGDTAGDLADGAGSTTVIAGRVSIVNTPTPTKVIMIRTRWDGADWA